MSRHVPDRPLPRYRHRPGRTPHPTRDPAGHSWGRAPLSVAVSRRLWRLSADYLQGFDLFRAGYYWEAHEIWEDLWRSQADPEAASLLHALIQTAAALLHRDSEQLEAAQTVGRRALSKLRGLPDTVMGVQIPALGRQLEAALADPESPPPELQLAERSRDRPGCATDLWVQPACTEAVDRAGYQILRSPSRRDYYSGHGLILDAAPDDLEAWLERCAEEAGGVQLHLWWEDETDFPGQIAAAFGARYARFSVLTSTTCPGARPLPTGVSLSCAESDRDWRDVIELSRSINGEAFGTAFAEFTRWRHGEHRSRLDEGSGRWWLARVGGELVASLGLYECDVALRFQDVQTRRDHRRRGIASALIGRALSDAWSRHPRARAVIVADAEGDAERLYRRLGFAPSGVQHLISRANAE